MLSKKGSSSLEEQQRVLSPVLEGLKEYKIVVIGDREFQSVKLGEWLWSRTVDFNTSSKKEDLYCRKFFFVSVSRDSRDKTRN
ncbi:MAG TPA: hypothetical protein DD761_18895 [Cyanobacteria bacterium UBA11691]|nr:hypothetical protein [Cyanobacteria bacterium UBA11691]